MFIYENYEGICLQDGPDHSPCVRFFPYKEGFSRSIIERILDSLSPTDEQLVKEYDKGYEDGRNDTIRNGEDE